MDRIQLLQQLDDEIGRLQQARQLLDGSEGDGLRAAASSNGRRGPRQMSTEARKRISEAQRARWARQKGQSTAGTQSKSASTSSASTAKRGPRLQKAAARARIAEAQKARWAKFKAAQKKK